MESSSQEVLQERKSVDLKKEKPSDTKGKIQISKLDYKGNVMIRIHHPFLPGRMIKCKMNFKLSALNF